jgi:hypothetical protein
VTLGTYFVVMQGNILLNGEVPMNMPPLHKDDSRFSPLNNQIYSMNTNEKRLSRNGCLTQEITSEVQLASKSFSLILVSSPSLLAPFHSPKEVSALPLYPCC